MNARFLKAVSLLISVLLTLDNISLAAPANHSAKSALRAPAADRDQGTLAGLGEKLQANGSAQKAASDSSQQFIDVFNNILENKKPGWEKLAAAAEAAGIKSASDSIVNDIENGLRLIEGFNKILQSGSAASKKAVMDALKVTGPAASFAAPALLNMLIRKDSGLRREAAQTIEAIGVRNVTVPQEAVDGLIELLSNKDIVARRIALELLVSTDLNELSSTAEAAIVGLGADQDPDVRQAAVNIAGRLGLKNKEYTLFAITVLKTALQDNDRAVAERAADYLEELDPEVVVPELREDLKFLTGIDAERISEVLIHLRRNLDASGAGRSSYAKASGDKSASDTAMSDAQRKMLFEMRVAAAENDAVSPLRMEQLRADQPDNRFLRIAYDKELDKKTKEVSMWLNRLGWTTDHIEWLVEHPIELGAVVNKAKEITAKYDYVIFCGMGGSRLCIDTANGVFSPQQQGLKMYTLGTTDAGTIDDILKDMEKSAGSLKEALSRTLIVPISKSGTTKETTSHKEYFEKLFTANGIESFKHMFFITDPGSSMEKEAINNRIPVMPIQLTKITGLDEKTRARTDVGGRFTAPSTTIFLLPLALMLGNKASQTIPEMLRYAVKTNTKSDTHDDEFVKFGSKLFDSANTPGRPVDKLTLLMPDALKPLAPWIEQLFEESLGKDGKGITIIYGENLLPDKLRSPEENDRLFLHLTLKGKQDPNKAIWDFVREKNYPRFDIEMSDIVELGAVMLGLQRTVATVAYLWDINFVDQPAVEGYKIKTKAIMAEVEKTGKPVEIPFDKAKSAKSGKLTLYWQPLVDAGAVTENELTAEVKKLGGTMDDAAAVYAALIMIFSRKPGFEVAEFAPWAVMTPSFGEMLQEARDRIATTDLKMASKLAIHPDGNHSFQQNVEGGRDIFFSTYMLGLEMRQPEKEYEPQLLKAQALGTIQSMVENKRKVVLIATDGMLMDAEDDLRALFDKAGNFLEAAQTSKSASQAEEEELAGRLSRLLAPLKAVEMIATVVDKKTGRLYEETINIFNRDKCFKTIEMLKVLIDSGLAGRAIARYIPLKELIAYLSFKEQPVRDEYEYADQAEDKDTGEDAGITVSKGDMARYMKYKYMTPRDIEDEKKGVEDKRSGIVRAGIADMIAMLAGTDLVIFNLYKNNANGVKNNLLRALKKGLTDKYPFARVACARALAALIKMTEAKQEGKKEINIQELIKESLPPELVSGLTHNGEIMRQASIDAVAILIEAGWANTPSGVVYDVLKGLKDKCTGVRISSAKAAKILIEKGMLNPKMAKQAQESLIRGLSENDGAMRQAAAEALVPALNATGESLELPVTYLAAGLTDRNEELQFGSLQAIKALAGSGRLIRAHEVMPALAAGILNAGNGELRSLYADLIIMYIDKGICSKEEVAGQVSLDNLMRGLSSSNGFARATAADLIAKLTKAGVFSVEEVKKRIPFRSVFNGLASDEDADMRLSCARVLETFMGLGAITADDLKGEIPVLKLMKYLKGNPYDYHTDASTIALLAKMHLINNNDVIWMLPTEGLVEGLFSADPGIRLESAKALAEFGNAFLLDRSGFCTAVSKAASSADAAIETGRSASDAEVFETDITKDILSGKLDFMPGDRIARDKTSLQREVAGVSKENGLKIRSFIPGREDLKDLYADISASELKRTIAVQELRVWRVKSASDTTPTDMVKVKTDADGRMGIAITIPNARITYKASILPDTAKINSDPNYSFQASSLNIYANPASVSEEDLLQIFNAGAISDLAILGSSMGPNGAGAIRSTRLFNLSLARDISNGRLGLDFWHVTPSLVRLNGEGCRALVLVINAKGLLTPVVIRTTRSTESDTGITAVELSKAAIDSVMGTLSANSVEGVLWSVFAMQQMRLSKSPSGDKSASEGADYYRFQTLIDQYEVHYWDTVRKEVGWLMSSLRGKNRLSADKDSFIFINKAIRDGENRFLLPSVMPADPQDLTKGFYAAVEDSYSKKHIIFLLLNDSEFSSLGFGPSTDPLEGFEVMALVSMSARMQEALARQFAELNPGVKENPYEGTMGSFAPNAFKLASDTTLDDSIELLKHGVDEVRAFAARQLGQEENVSKLLADHELLKTVAAELARALKEKDLRLRCDAAAAIGSIGATVTIYGNEVVPLLKEAASNSVEPEMRSAAEYALNKIGHGQPARSASDSQIVDVDSQQDIARIKDLINSFRGCFTAPDPDIVVLAPGRDNGQGEHVDYPTIQFMGNPGEIAHLYSMGGAIQQNYLIALGKHRGDVAAEGNVHIIYKDYDRVFSFKLSDLEKIRATAKDERLKKVPAEKRSYPDWAYHMMGVLMQAKERGYPLCGMNIAVTSNNPFGAGLSNSAANCVALAIALNQAYGLDLGKADIVKLARDGERDEIVGSTCGWLDQIIIAYAKKGHFIMIDYGKLNNIDEAVTYFESNLPATLQRLLLNTNIPRELAATEYSDRVKELETVFDVLGRALGRKVTSTTFTLGELNWMIENFDKSVSALSLEEAGLSSMDDEHKQYQLDRTATLNPRDMLKITDYVRKNYTIPTKIEKDESGAEKAAVLKRHIGLTKEQSFAVLLRRMRHQRISALRTPLTGEAAKRGDVKAFGELIDAEGRSLAMSGDFQITGDNGAQDKLLEIGFKKAKELGIDVHGRMEGGGGGGMVGFYVDRTDETKYKKWLATTIAAYNAWVKQGGNFEPKMISRILKNMHNIERTVIEPELCEGARPVYVSGLAKASSVGELEIQATEDAVKKLRIANDRLNTPRGVKLANNDKIAAYEHKLVVIKRIVDIYNGLAAKLGDTEIGAELFGAVNAIVMSADTVSLSSLISRNNYKPDVKKSLSEMLSLAKVLQDINAGLTEAGAQGSRSASEGKWSDVKDKDIDLLIESGNYIQLAGILWSLWLNSGKLLLDIERKQNSRVFFSSDAGKPDTSKYDITMRRIQRICDAFKASEEGRRFINDFFTPEFYRKDFLEDMADNYGIRAASAVRSASDAVVLDLDKPETLTREVLVNNILAERDPAKKHIMASSMYAGDVVNTADPIDPATGKRAPDNISVVLLNDQSMTQIQREITKELIGKNSPYLAGLQGADALNCQVKLVTELTDEDRKAIDIARANGRFIVVSVNDRLASYQSDKHLIADQVQVMTGFVDFAPLIAIAKGLLRLDDNSPAGLAANIKFAAKEISGIKFSLGTLESAIEIYMTTGTFTLPLPDAVAYNEQDYRDRERIALAALIAA